MRTRIPIAVAILTTLLGSATAQDPTQGVWETMFRLLGTQEEMWLGRSVGGVGDVDGDGVNDLLIAHEEPLTESGRVTVRSGSSGAVIHVLRGGTREEFGNAVLGVDDLDGDSVPDIVVGAPYAASPTGTFSVGRVTAFSGKTAEVLWTNSGTAVTWNGYSLAAVGDLDGDGVGDILSGAPLASPNGLSRAGKALLLSGRTGEKFDVIQGDAPWMRVGTSVAGLGDVDGDGIPDYAIGARGSSPIGTATGVIQGEVRVYSGATAALIRVFPSTSPADAYEFFGRTVAGVGDLDGDGRGDLAIGIPGSGSLEGRVEIRSCVSGDLIYEWTGETCQALGGGVASAGDVDGDGVPDVVVLAPGASNCCHDGPSTPGEDPGVPGETRFYSGASGELLQTFVVGGGGTSFGQIVAGVGDLDGDGLSEALAGITWLDVNGLEFAGGVWLYGLDPPRSPGR